MDILIWRYIYRELPNRIHFVSNVYWKKKWFKKRVKLTQINYIKDFISCLQ